MLTTDSLLKHYDYDVARVHRALDDLQEALNMGEWLLGSPARWFDLEDIQGLIDDLSHPIDRITLETTARQVVADVDRGAEMNEQRRMLAGE